jgi:hypothetical protein
MIHQHINTEEIPELGQFPSVLPSLIATGLPGATPKLGNKDGGIS